MGQKASRVIAEVTPQQWTGRPAKDALNMFVGAGVVTLMICLILAIFIPALQNGGVVTALCFVFAAGATIWDVVSTSQRESRFIKALTESVNEFIVESTGDPSRRITVDRFRLLIEYSGELPLSINGVPCLELKASGERTGTRQIVATVTAPDYGLDSFDRLLREEEQRRA